MQLVTEGVEFEAEQNTFVLPPATESNQGSVTTIVLSGTLIGSFFSVIKIILILFCLHRRTAGQWAT